MIVRNKDGSLRLCVDYRELNNKTIADRHPVPRVKDTLDNLAGQKWFSTIDQGKAYYQGFMHLESRALTDSRMHLLSSRDIWRDAWKIYMMNAVHHTWTM